jgi:metal-sulfur cluster biosynthetic enzyme
MMSAMTPGLKTKIYSCLAEIVDPCSAASASPMNLVEMGLIREVRISDAGVVDVDMRLTSPSCFMIGYMTKEARRLITGLPEVSSVEVHADTGLDWTPDNIDPQTAARRRRRLAELPMAPARGRTS